MSPLPFLRLPILVQRKILWNCHRTEIILFSFCSRKTRQIVRSANIPIGYLEIVYWENKLMFGDWPFIFVQDQKEKFRVPFDPDLPDSETVPTTGFGGIPVHLDIDHPALFVPYQQSFLGTCNKVIDYLMDLFSQQKPFVEVHTNAPNIMNIPFDKWIVTRVEVGDDQPMNQEQLTFLLEELELVNGGWMCIGCPMEVNKYSTGLWHDQIEFRRGDWLHLDAIIDSDSTYIAISEMGPPRNAQLNALLKKWISREQMRNLKKLTLEFDSPLSVDEVMDGIETHDQSGTTFWARRSDGTDGRFWFVGNKFNLDC